jgi:hypothetical protein
LQKNPVLLASLTLNMFCFSVANGVYQNTVYGVAAKLPFKYIGAVVLGSVSVSLIIPAGGLIKLFTSWCGAK